MLITSFQNFVDNYETLDKYYNLVSKHNDIKKIMSDKNFFDQPILEDYINLISDIDIRYFEYSSFVTSLYSMLEQFIEEVTMEYIDFLNNNIEQYPKLPKKISNNHAELSAKLMQKLNYEKYRSLITEKEIIESLYSCISNVNNNYKLNKIAYIDHAYNFKSTNINSFFENSLGLNGILDKVFKKDDTLKENKKYLDDIANRRNLIAHTINKDDLLSLEFIKMHMDYFFNFISVLNESINEILYSYFLEDSGNTKKICCLNNPIALFPSGSDKSKLFGVAVTNINLSNQDTLIVKRDEKIFMAKIMSLQHEQKTIQQVEKSSCTIQIGIKTDISLVITDQIFISYL